MKAATLICLLATSACFAAPLSIEAQLGQTTQTGSYERSGFVNYGDNQRTTFGDRGSYQNQSSGGVRIGINQPDRYTTRYPKRQYPNRYYGNQVPNYNYGPAVGYTSPPPSVGYTTGSGPGVISQSQVYVDTRPIAPSRQLSPFQKRRLIDEGSYYNPGDLRRYPNAPDRGHNNNRVPDRFYRAPEGCTNGSSPIYGRSFGDSGRDAQGGYDTLPRC